MDGVPRDRPHDALERLAIPARYEIGEPIYRCNDSIEHWYRVIEGAARESALTVDGRRHIVDFILAGDLFGFGASGARHCCVEAIVPGTVIARYLRRSAEGLAGFDPQNTHYVTDDAV